MRFRLIVASIVVVQALLIQQFVAQRFPLSADDHSYLYQARLFAAGQPYAEHALYDHRHPLHGCIETNCLRDEAGHRFSKYAPGWPLVLALGVLLQVPWLVQPLVAAALTILVLSFVRRTVGDTAEKTAGWLLVVCAFWPYYGASYRPHMLTALCVFGAFVAFERASAEPVRSRLWLLLSAALLGYSALVRYTDWIPLAAWIVFVLMRAGQIRSLVAFGAVFVGVAAGNLAWGWVLAERLFVLPTHLGGTIGDHDQMTLSWNGVLFTLGRLAMLCWVFPPVLLLVRGWSGRRAPGRRQSPVASGMDGSLANGEGVRGGVFASATGLYLGLFAANVAIYGLFGAAPGGPGPRYFLSYFPFLLIAVVAQGLDVVEQRATRRALWRTLVVAQVIGSAIFIARETYTLYGRRDVERTAIGGGLLSGTGRSAVVLQTGTYHTDARDLTMNPPNLDDAPVLYVANCGARAIDSLRLRYSDRRWFTYSYPGVLRASE